MALVNGLIKKGDDCPYGDECHLKYNACNGCGCPFVWDIKHNQDFSCGAARFFEIMDDRTEKEKIMKFKKYGSIEGAHRTKTVNYITETGNADGEWVSTLKIHGANYSLWTDGSSVKRGKRSGFVEGEAFYGDFNFNYDERVRDMFAYINETCIDMETLSIHGEIYGGKYDHPDVEKVKGAKKVQKEVSYRPDNDFIVFDIKVDGKLVK